MLVTPFRIIKFAFQNFVRNLWLAVATISIIVLALLSVNFFILANALVDSALTAVESKINISVYFKQSGREADFLTLADRLKAMSEVETIEYVSKDMALDDLKKKYEKEGNPIVTNSISVLESNPLTAKLIVRAKSLDGYGAVQAILNETQYEQLIDKKEFADRSLLIKKINELKKRIGQVGLFLNLFFIAIACLIVYNTIRITIYTRKREVGIMKLVGANNSFIRGPLILEGAMYSIIGMIITILVVYPLLGAIQPYTSYFDGQAFDVLGYFSSHFYTIFGYELLVASALTVISTSLAIGRYLKV